MSKNIYSPFFLNFINKKKYNNENEIEEYCFNNLSKLLNIKQERINRQTTTTPFDGTLSNRTDLIIYSKNVPDQIIIVFELKFHKTIVDYHGGLYEKGIKQLHKYCQDVKSPYGVLLSEKKCYI
jgi:hypothetical protein